MANAGLLMEDDSGVVTVSAERMAAMLALTAVHDIMKLPHLCPTVQEEHAPYHGHAAGETVEDHDRALGYILEHDIDCLPSVASLPARQQATVRFTQADLAFNHGHLVQAEAPPEAIFRGFMVHMNAGALTDSDVAFYFVHWLTDLAGAEPTPLCGAEKFVLKFPQPVLARLVSSMRIVQELAFTRPSELYERYLVDSWPEHLGLPPSGLASVALMRLMLQVQEQAFQEEVWQAFQKLHPEVRSTLTTEMALSGVPHEPYGRTPEAVGVPAFLLYYSPAFLRHCCALGELVEVINALAVLSEIYRAARKLWPHRDDVVEGGVRVVVIRIEELVKLDSAQRLQAPTEGKWWVLKRTGEGQGVVSAMLIDELLGEHMGGQVASSIELLRLWRPALASQVHGSHE